MRTEYYNIILEQMQKQDFIGILGFIDILKKYGENLDKDISTVAEMI